MQTPIPELAGVLSHSCLHCRSPTTALPTATIRGCAPPLASTGATLASGPRDAPALVPPRHWLLVCAFSVIEREPGGGPTRVHLTVFTVAVTVFLKKLTFVFLNFESENIIYRTGNRIPLSSSIGKNHSNRRFTGGKVNPGSDPW